VAVTNAAGSVTSSAVTLTVNRYSPPVVTVTAPAQGAVFASGATVAFAGTATDTQDGDLTANLVWRATGASGTTQIGTGAGGSVVLAPGAYVLTASVTDSLRPGDAGLGRHRGRHGAGGDPRTGHLEPGQPTLAGHGRQPLHGGQGLGIHYPPAGVSLTYFGAGARLSGTLAGSGLKPNFAYQIKLNGKPTRNWALTATTWPTSSWATPAAGG